MVRGRVPRTNFKNRIEVSNVRYLHGHARLGIGAPDLIGFANQTISGFPWHSMFFYFNLSIAYEKYSTLFKSNPDILLNWKR